jgi:hypothetical protein
MTEIRHAAVEIGIVTNFTSIANQKVVSPKYIETVRANLEIPFSSDNEDET